MNHKKHNCLGVAAFIALLVTASGAAAADGLAPSGQAESTQSGSSGQAGKTGTSAQDADKGAKGGAVAVPHIFMLVPVEVAAKENSMKRGCWAKVYSNENYAGDSLTLTGPVSLADMTGPFGLNWDDRVNSLEIGPKATLTVYDNENFRDMVSEFKAGQRVADVSKKLGFFDEFASVRLNCAKS